MSKNKLLAAKELIQAKRYAEARSILKTVDHPTAHEWLAKLDKIAPEKKGVNLSTIPYTYIIGLGVLVVLAAVIFVIVLNQSPGRILTENFAYSGVTFRYPRGWLVTTGPYQITLASKDTTNLEEASDLTSDTHVIFMTVAREVGSDHSPMTVAEASRDSVAEGYTDFDGNVIRAPAETSALLPVTIGSYSGVSFSFTLEGISTNNLILDTGNQTITTFTVISGDLAYFDSLSKEIINSYKFDPTLAGDFACPVGSWWENTAGGYVTQFLDTAEVAASTSRIAVSPLVLEMQRTYRDFENLDFPSCVSAVRDKLIDAMDDTVEGFTQFVGQSDTLSGVYLDQATEKFKAAHDALWDMGFFGADIRLGMTDIIW